jgi:hypothetical protein
MALECSGESLMSRRPYIGESAPLFARTITQEPAFKEA